ncbi:MAG: cytochrome c1 [Alphaproteobacteria bacterium]|nr:cytochrome c1 [Alphaproteobacteria bacterium]
MLMRGPEESGMFNDWIGRRGWCFFLVLAIFSVLSPVHAHENAASFLKTPVPQRWSFTAPFGTFDNAQLQRGFKVYKEVCSQCHSLSFLSFRNLQEPGGPEFSSNFVDSLASEFLVRDGPDDSGEMFDRPAVASDRFPAPFPNEQAARAAHNGIYPPDLSLITKARPAGANYVYALLTGYEDSPGHFNMPEGTVYNPYFPTLHIVMPPPLFDDIVDYSDGSPQTVDQYVRDVVAFLMWVAEPNLEARHKMGLNVLVFLFVLSVLLYLSKKRLWSRMKY